MLTPLNQPFQRDVLAGLSTAACPSDVAGSSPTSVLADMAIQFPDETSVPLSNTPVRPAMEEAAKTVMGQSAVKTGQEDGQDEQGDEEEDEGYEILSMDDF